MPRLTPAERELIELVRRREPFCCIITLGDDSGEIVIHTVTGAVANPANHRTGAAMSFSEAWAARRQPRIIAPHPEWMIG